MNAGEIRVLVGSTEMAGTGLNVQRRVIAPIIWIFPGHQKIWNSAMDAVPDRAIK